MTAALGAAAEYRFIRTVSVYGTAVLPLLGALEWDGDKKWYKQLMAAVRMQAASFLVPETLMILGLGLIAFMFDTFGGVLFGKLINLFAKKKINPMIGAAGISAFPMSSRVIAKMAKEEDPYNFILMQAAGANVAGQVASVIAGGIILALVGPLV